MLAWVLNTFLFYEDSLNVLLFKVFYLIRFLKHVISLKYFASFNSPNMLLNIELLNAVKNWIIKPFDLLRYYSIG